MHEPYYMMRNRFYCTLTHLVSNQTNKEGNINIIQSSHIKAKDHRRGEINFNCLQ